MLKKVFWVSLGFFLLTLVFLGVYQFAFRHNVNNPVADPEKRAAATTKEVVDEATAAKNLAFEAFLNEPILFPSAELTGVYYYSSRDKALKRTDYTRQETITLMTVASGEVRRLLWSPIYIGALALVEADGQSLWYHFDLRNGTRTPLRPDMSRLAWNSLGDSIYYQHTDPATDERSVNMANFDGNNWKRLSTVGTADYFLAAIPQSSRLSFWTRPNGLETSTLESVSITGEGRVVISTGKFGGDYLWSPDGHSLLIGSVDIQGGHSPIIGLTDGQGGNYRDLRIPTLVNKVVWSRDNQTLYFAQPGAFESGIILPNDYYAKPVFTKDTFWKMNTKTGKRERLVPLNEMNQAFDATSLFLSYDETSLFFIDRESSKLYRITL